MLSVLQKFHPDAHSALVSGCYTGTLQAALNLDQNIHIKNKDQYGQFTKAQQEVSIQEDESSQPLP